MPGVLNKRTDEIPPDAIYVGRPSVYGNPIRIGGRITRQDAVLGFKVYAEERLKKEPHWLDGLEGKDLVCWCHTWNGKGTNPLYCHADVLLELANS